MKQGRIKLIGDGEEEILLVKEMNIEAIPFVFIKHESETQIINDSVYANTVIKGNEIPLFSQFIRSDFTYEWLEPLTEITQ